jgi:hypothetical protein
MMLRSGCTYRESENDYHVDRYVHYADGSVADRCFHYDRRKKKYRK